MDHPSDTGLETGLDQGVDRLDVRPPVVGCARVWIEAGQGGKVDHRVGAGDHPGQGGVGQVQTVNLDPGQAAERLQPDLFPGGRIRPVQQAVDCDHLVSLAGQPLDQSRADEAGCAGDHDPAPAFANR